MEKNISKIKQRILQYADKKGINKRRIYIETGISNGILTKQGGLTEDNIEKFISVYKDINLGWLLSGKGDMILNESIDTHYNNSNELTLIKELAIENGKLKVEIDFLKKELEALKKRDYSTKSHINIAAEPELNPAHTHKKE